MKVGPAGKYLFDVPQQKWTGEDPNIMLVSRFAGQEMMAIQESDDQPNRYELHYLGMVEKGFLGMGAATAAAPEFARKVLDHLKALITD